MSLKRRLRTFACCAVLQGVTLFGVPMRPEQVPSMIMTQAKGTCDVKVVPQGAPDTADGIALGRMSIDKQFHGDLEATSKGEMLTSRLESNGSAAYVAIERVTGTLNGRQGTFALMHQGVMNSERQHLTVTVVPDSGTGQLAGLTGTMTITIVEKKHLYDFHYSLPRP